MHMLRGKDGSRKKIGQTYNGSRAPDISDIRKTKRESFIKVQPGDIRAINKPKKTGQGS